MYTSSEDVSDENRVENNQTPSQTQNTDGQSNDDFDDFLKQTFSLRPPLPEFDLRTLLHTSPLGNSILNFYETNNCLDQKRRSRLVDIIIKHLFTYIVKQ